MSKNIIEKIDRVLSEDRKIRSVEIDSSWPEDNKYIINISASDNKKIFELIKNKISSGVSLGGSNKTVFIYQWNKLTFDNLRDVEIFQKAVKEVLGKKYDVEIVTFPKMQPTSGTGAGWYTGPKTTMAFIIKK